MGQHTTGTLGEVRMVAHHHICGERTYVVRYDRSKRIAAVVTYTPSANAPDAEKWSNTYVNSDPFSFRCIHCAYDSNCIHVSHVRQSLRSA